MSAFISLVRDDVIEVCSDGALYLPNGRLGFVKQKIATLPEVPAAVFGRGADAIVGTLAHMTAILSPLHALAGRGAFDDLLKRTELELAPKIRAKIEEAGGVPETGHSEIMLAGFSEAAGPMVAAMRTFPQAVSGDEILEPWKLYRLPQIWFAGPNIADKMQAMGVTLDGLRRDGLEPHAVDLMQAMREVKDINPTAPHLPPIFGVGGHLQHVRITRDGAESRILHTWPDVIGEPIDPFRVAA